MSMRRPTARNATQLPQYFSTRMKPGKHNARTASPAHLARTLVDALQQARAPASNARLGHLKSMVGVRSALGAHIRTQRGKRVVRHVPTVHWACENNAAVPARAFAMSAARVAFNKEGAVKRAPRGVTKRIAHSSVAKTAQRASFSLPIPAQCAYHAVPGTLAMSVCQ